jgi:hypothetical protein
VGDVGAPGSTRIQLALLKYERRWRLAPTVSLRRLHESDATPDAGIAAWLDSWKLPGDVRTRIARFVATRASLDPNADRRRQLEAVLERLRKQHEWGLIADSTFLEEHRRLKRSLVELGPAAIVPPPSADALKMAAHIGGAWRRVSDETRRRFLGEWFAELRIEADGRVTMVPASPIARSSSRRSPPWAMLDSNQRPLRCERSALTS